MEEDILNYLPTVMFRGTTCTYNSVHISENVRESLKKIKNWGEFYKCSASKKFAIFANLNFQIFTSL